ncbi:Fe-S oxidoreductase [Desulfotomaculum nigrificans CO-1-SRB]|uniref:Fe-S oxidoreductase n=1 Tax=Desulfotomaculum nigrificans (strain DSM 14880 / VKM B-2319 / CO-1-SRB) TaxID=868595 RepID=F6B9V3_DESCC|nr:arsenosugar biosynthesis radical SAM (seleno)protein ArsS [Desulfotomaculum nigrificans]AEF93801.1 Fe-S oxidoreductase [Desulfotomaculum nigrificans CO-1-SRB]
MNESLDSKTANNYQRQLQYLRDVNEIKPFTERIKETEYYPLTSSSINTLQVNVGKVCNLSCKHCHVEAGPHRTESMSREIMSHCLRVLAEANIPILDINGGAPELNPHLPWFIEEAVKLGRRVMVRTNLTVLANQEQAHLMEFYASHGVEIISSLPYYRDKDTDRQRGQGVFVKSVEVLKALNDLGYGQKDTSLQLNLVYNPGGAFLPPSQPAIEADFRRELAARYGIVFNRLFTITNVPVGRFLTFLYESGNLVRYMERLAGAFNPAAAGRVMCRELISVGWDGQLYDCDFNQMLGLNCRPGHITDFDLAALKERKIVLHNHCYACTAGAGSSCGGAIA